MLLSTSALRDWAILLVLGSLFETARRILSSIWNWIINSFFITAVFDDEDTSYRASPLAAGLVICLLTYSIEWIMLWLSKQPSWKGARNVQISTNNFGILPAAVQISGVDDHSDGNSRRLAYLPAISESYTLWHNYRWTKVTRLSETCRGGWGVKETLTLSIFTRDHQVLAEILQEAKRLYIEAEKDSITVYVSDIGNHWRNLATRPKRPLNSIILDPGIQELVVDDARDFLDSKSWYSERGIPFRRGYLLYGAPGSGKTSLIHSIAGELGLDIYIISLSRSGLDDTALSELISDLPERCIALMEDIDAAFHHGLNREPKQSPSSPTASNPEEGNGQRDNPAAPSVSRVSLSGLLNALDGIGAQEGRILFATTNKYRSLDPALCRPGRMDLHVEFKLASKYQAEELFKRFYAPSPSELAARADVEESENSSVDSGFDSSSSNDLIDLTEPSGAPSPSTLETSEKTSLAPPAYVGTSHRSRAPKLSMKQVCELAATFAAAVPDRQLSMASLQGYLMTHKIRPFEAVTYVAAWIEKEQEQHDIKTE
ncbi:hypothetical protein HYDPIDRAFT_88652 [Hydnomerulius pinastri MD-312]|nr:hypothetical protein HYDPIDRAFT_88652 [Hydnomerulius pinastri MD-312]